MAKKGALWQLLEDESRDRTQEKEGSSVMSVTTEHNDEKIITLPPTGTLSAGPSDAAQSDIAPLLARFHGLHLQHELDNEAQAKLKQELDELSPRLAKGEEYCSKLDPKDKSDKANAARAKLRELRKQRDWLRLQIGDYQTGIDRAAVEMADVEIAARDAAGMPGAHICVVCFGLYVDWGQHQSECCPWEGQGKQE